MSRFYNQYKDLFFGSPFGQAKLNQQKFQKYVTNDRSLPPLRSNQYASQKQKLQNIGTYDSNISQFKDVLNSKNQSPMIRKKYKSTVITPSHYPYLHQQDQFKRQILPKLQQLNSKNDARMPSVLQQPFANAAQNKDNDKKTWLKKATFANPANPEYFDYTVPAGSSAPPQQHDYSIGRSNKKNVSSEVQKALHFSPVIQQKKVKSDTIHKKQPYGKPTLVEEKPFKSIFQMDGIQDKIKIDLQKNLYGSKKRNQHVQFNQQNPKQVVDVGRYPLEQNSVFQKDNAQKAAQLNAIVKRLRNYNNSAIHAHIPQISSKNAVHNNEYEYYYDSRNNIKSRQVSRQKSQERRRKSKQAKRQNILINRAIRDNRHQKIQKNQYQRFGYTPQTKQNPQILKQDKYEFGQQQFPLTMQEQEEIRERVSSPIDFSQYQKQNQFAFVNKRLEDVRKIQHFHPRKQINAYQQALQRRKQTKQKKDQRKKRLKQIISIEQGEFLHKQKVI